MINTLKVLKIFKNIFIFVIAIIIFFLSFGKETFASCSGRIFNPLSDVCWTCILPVSISEVQSKGSVPDTPNPPQVPCFCPNKCIPTPAGACVPIPGVPIGFWEGIKIFDMSKEPFCFVALGGMKIQAQAFTGIGSESERGRGGGNAVWHLHEYMMPIFQIISMVFDALCLEISTVSPFDIGYMTELDPMWLDDELTFVLNPEAVSFGNATAQAACVADCTAATSHLPLDPLFWCGGCQGSMYPLTGNIPSDYGSIQSTNLTLQRFMAKMHRELQAWDTSGQEAMCQPIPLPIIKKSQYRTQLTYPVPMRNSGLINGCQPMGRSNVLYDFYKEIPVTGESFGYLLWRKRNCCAL
jgi:conjugal transfer pilus assembly protein TraU